MYISVHLFDAGKFKQKVQSNLLWNISIKEKQMPVFLFFFINRAFTTRLNLHILHIQIFTCSWNNISKSSSEILIVWICNFVPFLQ